MTTLRSLLWACGVLGGLVQPGYLMAAQPREEASPSVTLETGDLNYLWHSQVF